MFSSSVKEVRIRAQDLLTCLACKTGRSVVWGFELNSCVEGFVLCVFWNTLFKMQVLSKSRAFYPNGFSCTYKNEFLATSFPCISKLSSRLFISSVGQERCGCPDNWLIYSRMQIHLLKYLPCLHVYLLVGVIVSPGQKLFALPYIIIHKGSFLSYSCSCTIFMIAIWYLSSFKVIKWLKILLLTSRCNI